MLTLLLRLAPSGFHLTAPVCSSFTWINRYSSGRSTSSPLGNTTRPRIATANQMVTRTILSLLVCSARVCWWVLEQAVLSIMQGHPAFKLLCRWWPSHAGVVTSLKVPPTNIPGAGC
jgi:hypothetical protein